METQRTSRLLQMEQDAQMWCAQMECQTVEDLNRFVRTGKIRELIRVNEALHEKRYAQIADAIFCRGAKVVMLAGPSSSGKTTSAYRLATQLRVMGCKPIVICLDDYYIDRDKILPGKDGELDLEHINAIDTILFQEHIVKLLSGEKIQLPTFDFLVGKRTWSGHYIQLQPESIVIVEGIHALNPVLLPKIIESGLIFKLYISPILPLKQANNQRISSSTLRLLRRTVRDYETRGSRVENTLRMWDSVRRGEENWIFPFRESADMFFNSATVYELAVLKKHIYPLLMEVSQDDVCYEQVCSIIKLLDHVVAADINDEIPPAGLIREFIGGSCFYK